MLVLKFRLQSVLVGDRLHLDAFQGMDRKDLSFETEGVPRLDKASWSLDSRMAARSGRATASFDLSSPIAR